MKSEDLWLSVDVAPEMINSMPTLIKDKMGRIVEGRLKIEKVDGQGRIIVSAHFNSSPFPAEVVPAKFFLTEEQLGEFLNRGPKCVLVAPLKVVSELAD